MGVSDCQRCEKISGAMNKHESAQPTLISLLFTSLQRREPRLEDERRSRLSYFIARSSFLWSNSVEQNV